jgi:hypothetical protein
LEIVLYSLPVTRLYIILDALDECEKESLKWVLSKIAGLAKRTTNDQLPIFKIIIFSRRHPMVIPRSLGGFLQINLFSGKARRNLTDDVELFVKSKIEELVNLKSREEEDESKQQSLKDKWQLATRKLKHHVHETFLWISFAIRELEDSPLHEVESALERIPSGLDNYFARMFEHITDLGESYDQFARQAICWVALAMRPISLAELATVTCNTTDTTEELLKRCGYLFRVDDGIVRLIHQSALDFLTRPPVSGLGQPVSKFMIDKPTVHEMIAQHCLSYIMTSTKANGYFPDISTINFRDGNISFDNECWKAHPLFHYATLYWTDHAQLSSNPERILDLMLRSEGFQWHSWFRIYWLCRMPGWDFPEKSFNEMHLAGFFGLNIPTPNGLHRGPYELGRETADFYCSLINSVSINGMMPLHWAVRNGHTKTAEVFIELGANIHALGAGMTPLIWAVRGSSREVVIMLLDKGADIDSAACGMTPLHWAALEGRLGMTKLLLQEGANITTKTTRWVIDENASNTISKETTNGAKVFPNTFAGRPDEFDQQPGTAYHVQTTSEVFAYIIPFQTLLACIPLMFHNWIQFRSRMECIFMLLVAASGLLLFGRKIGRLEATRTTIIYVVSLLTAWFTHISFHDALVCMAANMAIFLSLWNGVAAVHMQIRGSRRLCLVLPQVFGVLMTWASILDRVDVTFQLSNWAVMIITFSLPVFRAQNYRPGKTALELAKLGGNTEVVQLIARETQLRRRKRGRMAKVISVQ